eukprot:366444-Chlamydomonas_euryale.AAC.39
MKQPVCHSVKRQNSSLRAATTHHSSRSRPIVVMTLFARPTGGGFPAMSALTQVGSASLRARCAGVALRPSY